MNTSYQGILHIIYLKLHAHVFVRRVDIVDLLLVASDGTATPGNNESTDNQPRHASPLRRRVGLGKESWTLGRLGWTQAYFCPS